MTNCLQSGYQRCPGRCIPASGKGVHQSKEMMPARVLELPEAAGRTEKAASALDMAFRSNVPNKHGCDSTCAALPSQTAGT